MRQSVKQRLILALQQELEEALLPDTKLSIASVIYDLGNRGSGPLPHWAREMAKARGIV